MDGVFHICKLLSFIPSQSHNIVSQACAQKVFHYAFCMYTLSARFANALMMQGIYHKSGTRPIWTGHTSNFLVHGEHARTCWMQTPAVCCDTLGHWTLGCLLSSSPQLSPETDVSSQWTEGVDSQVQHGDQHAPLSCFPGLAPATLPLDCVHHVPSFIGALGCMASIPFSRMQSAVCTVGLTETYVDSLHLLAALVAELVEAFPCGVFLRNTCPPRYWLLQHGLAQLSCMLSGCSTHIFMQRDEHGHFSPMVHLPCHVGAYNFPFSVAYIALWDTLPPLKFPDCFFRAVGLNRSATVAAAAAALPFHHGGLQPHFAGRLLQLAKPEVYVSGFDIQMFVILLPTFFPAGLLLLLDKGVLVHLQSASAPRSLSPEADSYKHNCVSRVLLGVHHVSTALSLATCFFWAGPPSLVFVFSRASGHSDARLCASLGIFHGWPLLPCCSLAARCKCMVSFISTCSYWMGSLCSCGASVDDMLPSLLREVLGVQFPDAKLRELMPSVHAHCSLVSQALSVPLSWVLLAETCTAAFLAPTSVLWATKSFPIFPMPWAMILDPGATQTSGLMAACNRALRQLELWEDEHQKKEAQAKNRAAMEAPRLALPLHNLVQVADGTTPENWQYEISEAAIQASVTFSTWMGEVFSKLDLLRSTAPGEARTASDAAPAPSPRDELARIMNVTDLAALLHPVDTPLQTLRAMMLAVLEFITMAGTAPGPRWHTHCYGRDRTRTQFTMVAGTAPGHSLLWPGPHRDHSLLWPGPHRDAVYYGRDRTGTLIAMAGTDTPFGPYKVI